MRKTSISIIGALTMAAALAGSASAQQLYINDIEVGDGGGGDLRPHAVLPRVVAAHQRFSIEAVLGIREAGT